MSYHSRVRAHAPGRYPGPTMAQRRAGVVLFAWGVLSLLIAVIPALYAFRVLRETNPDSEPDRGILVAAYILAGLLLAWSIACFICRHGIRRSRPRAARCAWIMAAAAQALCMAGSLILCLVMVTLPARSQEMITLIFVVLLPALLVLLALSAAIPFILSTLRTTYDELEAGAWTL